MELLAWFSSASSYINNGCCTFRRMLIIIAVFLGLSILMLWVQYYLTRGESITYTSLSVKRSTVSATAVSSEANASSDRCWQHEEHVVLAECVACTQFEITAGIRPCKPSGFYEKINCTNTGIVYRSCHRVRWVEERNFIAFLITSSLCAVIFTCMALWRQKTLDRVMLEKLHRQLGDGM